MNKIQDTHYKQVGFTLIELLIVIVIISILAAILFPVFSSAREKSRQATCASNEKQLGLAFLQYTQDYDELMPGIGDGFTNASTIWQVGAGWAGTLYGYVKSTSVYDCPDDTTAIPSTPGLPGDATYISYIFNADLVDTYNYGTNLPGTVDRPTAPSMTVLLAEGQGTTPIQTDNPLEGTCPNPGQLYSSPSGSGVDIYQAAYGSPCQDNVTYYAAGDLGGYNNSTLVTLFSNGGNGYLSDTGRHLGGSNFVMLDGHVKWMRGETVSVGYAANTPNDQQTSANVNGFPTAAGTSGTLPNGLPIAATFSPI